jgi:hypothetical protein
LSLTAENRGRQPESSFTGNIPVSKLIQQEQMNKQRIAILMHERAEHISGKHLIDVLADYWREDGCNVILLYGTKHFIPADLLFVHVDLSVVPDAYLTFAKRYPMVINGDIKDIRKETFSQNLLTMGDPWNGPVIVKTNKNYAGRPEAKRDQYDGITGYIRQKFRGARIRLNPEWLAPSIKEPADYPIYRHLREVPRLYFYHPGLIIQKFMPEIENGLYCLHNMLFLGGRFSCLRLKSENQIVNMGTAEEREWNMVPHPKLVALRNRLGLDYGKFDYVIIDGEPILLDVNKTIGWPGRGFDEDSREEMMTHIEYLSKGVYHFFLIDKN